MKPLLLKNFQPLGFARGVVNSGEDILIDSRGNVTRVSPEIEDAEATVCDLGGFNLSPGWIDLHTHVYWGATNLSVRPMRAGPDCGVTALLDVGSAGEANFPGLREYVIEPSPFPIYALLNVGSIGMVLANAVSEFDCMEKYRPEKIRQVVDGNRDVIRGMKIRASESLLHGWGMDALRLALKSAGEVDLPLMVHVGEPPPRLDEILRELRPGDMVAHCFHGKEANMAPEGRLIPEAREAYDRGVQFDVGHGNASFSFDVAERAIEAGLKPHSVSSDLHIFNVNGPVHDLATTMTKMMCAGLTLKETLAGVTRGPAAWLRIPSLCDSIAGEFARFTLFHISDEPIDLMDSRKSVRTYNRRIVPSRAIVGNQVFDAKVFA